MALVWTLIDGAHVASWAPGGSGQLLAQEITASQIAAAWDSDYLQSAIALEGISPGDLIQNMWEDENSLDQGVTFDDLSVYLPDESTANVSDHADHLNGVISSVGTNGTYVYTVNLAANFGVIKVGSQPYALFTGDASPTTGASTIKTLISAA